MAEDKNYQECNKKRRESKSLSLLTYSLSLDERDKNELWKYVQWMEDWENNEKKKKKDISLDFPRW